MGREGHKCLFWDLDFLKLVISFVFVHASFKSASVTAMMTFCSCFYFCSWLLSEAAALPVLLLHILHIFKAYHQLLNRQCTQAFEEISVYSGILTL